MFCQVCKADKFLVYRKYQGQKVNPPRCLGCIIRFPPPGVELVTNNSGDFKTYLRIIKHKYHTWVLIRQTDKLDVWKCPRCGQILFSPKLGIPYSLGCVHGTDHLFRKGFWASVKLQPQCPLCDKKTEIITIPRLLKRRPGKTYFPHTCVRCFE